jgi:hypothetical protein
VDPGCVCDDTFAADFSKPRFKATFLSIIAGERDE